MSAYGDETLPEPRLRRVGWKEVLQSLIGFAIAISLLAFGMPWIVDTTWADIGSQLSMVGGDKAAIMFVLMLLGLYSYTFTLIGSLPGLTHVRALMVNAAGSMVSNILPAGGAVGVALSYVMYRSWGFTRKNISTSLVVTGIWNVLARVALPVLGAGIVVWGPVDAPQSVLIASLIAGAIGTGVVLVFSLAIYSDRVSHWLGHALSKLFHLVRRSRQDVDVDTTIQDQRARMSTVVRVHGIKMTLGLAGMFGFFFVLYWVASRSVGLDLPVYMLFAAYAFRQFLTVVAITPGGLGITEVGTAGVLVAFGGDPGAASAAALLYALFTHLLEVPLGLAAWLTWWFGPKHKALAQGQLDEHIAGDDNGSSPTVADCSTGDDTGSGVHPSTVRRTAAAEGTTD